MRHHINPHSTVSRRGFIVLRPSVPPITTSESPLLLFKVRENRGARGKSQECLFIALFAPFLNGGGRKERERERKKEGTVLFFLDVYNLSGSPLYFFFFSSLSFFFFFFPLGAAHRVTGTFMDGCTPSTVAPGVEGPFPSKGREANK